MKNFLLKKFAKLKRRFIKDKFKMSYKNLQVKHKKYKKALKEFREGTCKCGNRYLYCGEDIGYCVKCLDRMEVENTNTKGA